MSTQMPLAFGNGQVASWIRPGFGKDLPKGLSALQRVAAHDFYHGLAQDGQSYADGSIYMAAIFTPDDPAVKPLLEKPELREALFQYAQWDLGDDGIANGSPAAQIMADFHWYSSGESIHHQLLNAPKRQFTWDLLNTPTPDNATPDGFAVQADWLGLSQYELMGMSLWGHDGLPGGQGAPVQLDDYAWNGSAMVNALNNPLHPDYNNVNGIPGMRGFVNHLIDWDKQHFGGEVTGWALNWWNRNALVKMFNR